jgi:hypothetical protein
MDARTLIDDFDFEYIGGDGAEFDNAYHLAMNIYLVSMGFRPAFIITPGEFDEEDAFVQATEQVSRYLQIEDTGEFVICWRGREDRNTARMIVEAITLRQQFEQGGDPDVEHRAEVTLGRLLGYPCAGQLPGNYFVRLRVRGNMDIITNICNNQDSYLEALVRFQEMKEELEEFFGRVRRFERVGLVIEHGPR